MPVVNNDAIRRFHIPGLEHQTLAGPEHGMQTLEMWMQTIAPGAGTPVHRHACEEAILILRGSGRCTIEGVDTDFGPNSTLQIPSDAIHQIVNTGTEEMFLVAALGQAPGPSLHRGQPAPAVTLAGQLGRRIGGVTDWFRAPSADSCPDIFSEP
jgi:mannose-6-phosphate isomerase-like protein (cupin superfamily)